MKIDVSVRFDTGDEYVVFEKKTFDPIFDSGPKLYAVHVIFTDKKTMIRRQTGHPKQLPLLHHLHLLHHHLHLLLTIHRRPCLQMWKIVMRLVLKVFRKIHPTILL